jgi:hypothetical protein
MVPVRDRMMTMEKDNEDDRQGYGLPGFVIGLGPGGHRMDRDEMARISALMDVEESLMDPHKLAQHLMNVHVPNPLQIGIANAIEAHGRELTKRFGAEKEKVIAKQTEIVEQNNRLRADLSAADKWFNEVEVMAVEAAGLLQVLKDVISYNPSMGDDVCLLSTANPNLKLTMETLRLAVKAADKVFGNILTRPSK